MTTTEQALEGARRVAKRAAQIRAGVDKCPYPADGTPVQKACRRAWLRTYLHWRPDEAPPVDYGDDLTALAHGPDTTTADTGGDDGGGVDTPAAAAARAAQGLVVLDGG